MKEAKSVGTALPPNWQGARPVDGKEAARGRVDIVRVADWGSGKPEDLGALQVADDGGAAPAAGRAQQRKKQQAANGPSADVEAAKASPPSLFKLLAAAAQSPLTQQRMKKLSEVPPFERWHITTDRYLLYCANLHHVHCALEDTVAAITASPPETTRWHGTALAAALKPLGPALPVARSAYLLADIQAVQAMAADGGSSSSSSSTTPDSTTVASAHDGCSPATSSSTGPVSGVDAAAGQVGAGGAARDRQRGKGGSLEADCSSSSSSGSALAGVEPVASTSGRPAALQPIADAAAYARYLQQLSRSWRSADSSEEQARLVGMVVAHLFAVHVSYAGLATRVGAAAAEKLGLFQVGAVSAYRDYPEGVTDHLAGLIAALDVTEHEVQGLGMQEAVGEAAAEELPRALVECALLVKPIAVAA